MWIMRSGLSDKTISRTEDKERPIMMLKMMGQMMDNNPMMGMMSGIRETANSAKFATAELRGLFKV